MSEFLNGAEQTENSLSVLSELKMGLRKILAS
jgi:hypothetical protein